MQYLATYLVYGVRLFTIAFDKLFVTEISWCWLGLIIVIPLVGSVISLLISRRGY